MRYMELGKLYVVQKLSSAALILKKLQVFRYCGLCLVISYQAIVDGDSDLCLNEA